MAEKTLIAWTDHTFSIAWGCTKISEGCRNCYAEEVTTRRGDSMWGPRGTRKTLSDGHWAKPLGWNRKVAVPDKNPAKRVAGNARGYGLVFSSSMCDNFEAHPTVEAQLARLWPLIRATPFLHWQLLTKRPERIASLLPDDWGPDGYPNVWLGTSVEDMRVAHRVQHLVQIPAAVRFISYEPALGPLDDLDLTGLDWVIYGGESGPNFRPHDLAWPRSMRARCREAGVAFFYKQSSARYTEMGTTLDGETVREMPVPRIPQSHPSFPVIARVRDAQVQATTFTPEVLSADDIVQETLL